MAPHTSWFRWDLDWLCRPSASGCSQTRGATLSGDGILQNIFLQSCGNHPERALHTLLWRLRHRFFSGGANELHSEGPQMRMPFRHRKRYPRSHS